MNAPLPRGLAPLDGRSVIPQEISVPTRGVLARALRTGRRRRRRGQRDSDRDVHNHSTERWMVSYADFVTLLFAFFVVMYAVSSVNEGRYRVLSGALSTAFSPSDVAINGGPASRVDGPKSMPGIPTEKTPAAAAAVSLPAPTVKDDVKAVGETPIDAVDRAEARKTAERIQHMTQLAARVDEHLLALVRDGQVTVTRGARGIAIEINAAVLFDPAKAELKPASFESLRSLASVLSGFVEPLQIEGHSDDIPIATREYKSNWELSAARAASVGRFLIDQGIAPNRIGIAGYAEFRPLVGNTSPESRARNRRVTLLVLSADDARPKEGVSTDAGAPSEPR
jgi:chemotaxis protein MotB